MIVNEYGTGAMALFNDEVVMVVLNGKRVDLNRRLPARKVAETAAPPRVRMPAINDREPHYAPFVEAP